ncbi:hypothetical protein AB656_05815 [Bifidobacterium actinocoloniiforme DSM 22766]|nr:hypothetical protein AB656_05815 [Bifidobacterium actinocoloniiforme DSM 22766]
MIPSVSPGTSMSNRWARRNLGHRIRVIRATAITSRTPMIHCTLIWRRAIFSKVYPAPQAAAAARSMSLAAQGFRWMESSREVMPQS